MAINSHRSDYDYNSIDSMTISITRSAWFCRKLKRSQAENIRIREKTNLVPRAHVSFRWRWPKDTLALGTGLPCFKPRYACAVKPELLKSWSLEIDYSRAPCLGADQKTRGLWEPDWENRLHDKSFRIQSSHFKFRIQILRRHDQTGEFLFRSRPLVCKQQNQTVLRCSGFVTNPEQFPLV